MANVEKWITVHPNGKENKGQPIPVMEGQSKGEAVKSFVESKTGKEYRQNTSYAEIQEKKRPLEDKYNTDDAKENPQTSVIKEKTNNPVYDFIKTTPQNFIKIHGEYKSGVKPYALISSWINPSKYGGGYYFSLDIDGKRHFIPIDYKTANGRRFYEPSILGEKAMKINANGYIYLDKNNKARYVIKDLNNYARVYDN